MTIEVLIPGSFAIHLFPMPPPCLGPIEVSGKVAFAGGLLQFLLLPQLEVELGPPHWNGQIHKVAPTVPPFAGVCIGELYEVCPSGFSFEGAASTSAVSVERPRTISLR